jgi:O-antigen biosynthesis protein
MIIAPKISILLTSYNHAKYLRDAIESVLNQTYKDFELLVWDDASVDNSWEIITSYSDERIHAFRNHTNQVEYFYKAISDMTQGLSEYIAIHHSDDVWEPKKLEKQVAYLDKNPDIGAVFSWAKFINEEGELFEDETHPYYKLFEQPNRTRHEWLNHFFYKGNALCHPSLLIRKECYQEVGLYRNGMAQLPDFDMWVRLVMKYEIHVIPEKLIRFRIHQDKSNSSGNRSDTRIRIQFEYLQVLENYREILSYSELAKIFPIAKKYERNGSGDTGFALGMIAVETAPFPFTKLLGLNLIFEALNDPIRAKKLKEEYNFSHADFIKLSAKHDVFSIEIRNLHEQLTGIMNSETWKLALFFRQTREKLIPIGSQRDKLAQRAYSSLKMWRNEGMKALIVKIKNKVLQRSDYQRWIINNEPSKKDLAKQRSEVEAFDYKPLISVIMPVWNTPVEILDQTIKSVTEQTYSHWELCVADGNSNIETQRLISIWTEKDPRIKIKFLKENQGIAVNTNEALSLAQGEFIAFLDHDDLLAPFALFEVLKSLQSNRAIDIIYSDEDLISENGKKRYGHHFKPDFSPDLLRSLNYITHFLIIRKTLGDSIGWLRKGYEGAQDYDLILRAVEKTKNILHIPKILYHWRHWSSSTTNAPNTLSDAKKLANEVGKKALSEHLERCGLEAVVENGPDPTTYQVKYIHSETPLISIIILNRDHANDLNKCINSIRNKSTYQNYEIIIVENKSSTKETFQLYDSYQKDSSIRIINYQETFNYSRANNFGASQATGSVLLFLNNDIEIITHDWLERMLEHVQRKNIGIVGAKLYFLDNKIQHAGAIIGIKDFAGHAHKHFSADAPGYANRLRLIQNYSAVTGACLMIRKDVFDEIGGFDEQYPLAGSDIDLCLKALSKHYLVVWTPYAELYHYESKTRGDETTREQKKRFDKEKDYFQQQWDGFLEKGDPFYNPNLTLEHEDFRLVSRARR